MRKYNFHLALEGEDKVNAEAFMQALKSVELLGSPRTTAMVHGEVISANDSYLCIHIPGTKFGGIVEKKEAGDLLVGDTADFWVLKSQGPEDLVQLSHRKAKGWQTLAELAETDEAIEARVFALAMRRRDQSVHGLRIVFDQGDLKDLRGFVPRSEIPRGMDFDSYVDKTVNVKVLSADPEHGRQFGNMVGSIKFFDDQKNLDLVAGLEIGQIVTGTVKKVISLKTSNAKGAIVELDMGVDAFIHESQVGGVAHSSIGELLPQGMTRNFEVTRLDTRNGKVSLSTRNIDRKEKLAEINTGDILPGTVVKVESFGYFVDLGGIRGLLHWSELKPEAQGKAETFAEGDTLEVSILNINEDGSRVALSRKTIQS